MTRSSRPKTLHESRTLVENAACLPEISSAQSGYGYAEARFKKGLDLLDGADGLSRNKAEDAKGIAALKLMGRRK
jgi:hypothetical protein